MSTILGFKNLEAEELEEHACSDALRSKMSNFHDQIMKVTKCSNTSIMTHNHVIH